MPDGVVVAPTLHRRQETPERGSGQSHVSANMRRREEFVRRKLPLTNYRSRHSLPPWLFGDIILSELTVPGQGKSLAIPNCDRAHLTTIRCER